MAAACEHGVVEVGRYRGRAGQPRSVQEAEWELLTSNGGLPVSALA